MKASRASRAATALGAWMALGAGACGGCGKTPPEITSAEAGPSDGGSESSSARPDRRHPRDDAGHLIPKSSPPPDDPDAAIPQPKREPDWDLDSDDAARDYVKRYVLGTRRYGDSLDCIDVGASQPFGDKWRVEVRVATSCPDPGSVRDVFVVDVAADRLTVDDKALRAPLALWPDGSNTEAPPGRVVEVGDLRNPKDNLLNELRRLQIVPIRLQFYGRGTYPVVTLAGWHGKIVPTTTEDDLRPIGEALCKVTHGLPLGFFGGLDRSHILRIRCPASARWDQL